MRIHDNAAKTVLQACNEHSQPESEAIRRCDEALSELLATRGRLHLDQGNSDLAVADFCQALQFGPQNALAHYCRSLAHQNLRNTDAARIDREAAFLLDPHVDVRTVSYRLLQSGYRVIALYNSGEEDHRPLGFYPHSTAGFRRAIHHAQALARSSHARSDLDNRYQLDADDVTIVVQEYHLAVRDVAALPPQDEPFQVELPAWCSRLRDRIRGVEPFSQHGHWQFWDEVFDRSAAADHNLTEEEAIVFTRAIEEHVRQCVPENLTELWTAFSRLTNPRSVAIAAFDLCRRPPGNFTGEQLLRCLVDQDENEQFVDLDRFVVEFRTAKEHVANAVTADNQLLINRLPAAAKDNFLHDVGVFVGEEFIKAIANSSVPNATVAV